MSVVYVVRVDDKEVRMGLRKAARVVQKDANTALARYADREIVPAVKHLAPRVIRDTITTKAFAYGAYLTTSARGKRRAIVGASNFGGVARAPIVPRRRQALRMPDGSIRAKVTTPRRMKGIHFMERGIGKNRDGIVRTLDVHVTRALQRRIIGIETRDR